MRHVFRQWVTIYEQENQLSQTDRASAGAVDFVGNVVTKNKTFSRLLGDNEGMHYIRDIFRWDFQYMKTFEDHSTLLGMALLHTGFPIGHPLLT